MKDTALYDLIAQEEKRQKEGIELIPSENYASTHVRTPLASVLGNKYSEGYPKKRYYGGNEVIDDVEILAQERAKKLFGVPHANIQPYSGSPANFAVYVATCQPGDTIMGLNLLDGGHLTHGWKVSATALFYKSVPYHVTKQGKIDFNEVARLAKQHKPKLMWTGATAYVYKYDFETFGKIADSVGAYFAADIAHVAGLVIGGAHPSPVPYAHIVTTTTHKTLRGPRGGMIMVTEKGLQKDPELAEKIDRAIFPGLQGGPHDHQTASIAVALWEASRPEFKDYARQIVENASILGQEIKKAGFTLVGGGTENHMILVNLSPSHSPGAGVFAQKALDMVGITLNKNTVPGEPSSPFYPSGIRLGSPAATTRGMGKKEMQMLADVIVQVLNLILPFQLPEDKKERPSYIKAFEESMRKDPEIKRLREEIKSLALAFPVE